MLRLYLWTIVIYCPYTTYTNIDWFIAETELYTDIGLYVAFPELDSKMYFYRDKLLLYAKQNFNEKQTF